jgi:hypothetical protein
MNAGYSSGVAAKAWVAIRYKLNRRSQKLARQPPFSQARHHQQPCDPPHEVPTTEAHDALITDGHGGCYALAAANQSDENIIAIVLIGLVK